MFTDGVKHWSLTALSDHYRNDTMFIKEENPTGADSLEKYIDIKYYGETLMFKLSILFNFKCCANHRPVAGQSLTNFIT